MGASPRFQTRDGRGHGPGKTVGSQPDNASAMAMPNIRSVAGRKIFVSYCHADYASVLELNKNLQAMCQRLGDSAIFLDCQGDSKLMAGDEWKAKITAALEAANVFVVLMSTDFHASQFCREVELRRMLERRKREPQLRIFGIALHKINLHDFWATIDGQAVSLEEGQCIPQEQFDGPTGRRLGLKPVSRWKDKRDAWVKVVEQIEDALLNGDRPVFSLPEVAQRVEPVVSAPNPSPIEANHLPYLCDRDEQYDALLASLAPWRKSDFSRPLVLVTEGRTDDCLAKWVERLRQHEITRALGFEELGLSFGHFKPFKWPAASAALPSSNESRQRFVRALAAVLCPHPLASETEAFDAHLTRARPTLLWVDCADSCLPEHARRALAGLLAVLSACPRLTQRTMLVVAINLVREPGAPANARARLAEDFESVISEAVAAGGVQAQMLGSLPEVDEMAINAWSAHEHVSGRLIDDIEMLCNRLPAGRGTWPMRTFAEVARQWFHGP